MSTRPRTTQLDPIACDCCGNALQPVFGTFHRAEREFGWCTLPYVLCGSCALQHRRGATEAKVREWVLTRAARAGQSWQAAVAQIVDGASAA